MPMTLQGADYRGSGYVGGEASMTLETLTMNYERGRMFSIDSMDNEETAGVGVWQTWRASSFAPTLFPKSTRCVLPRMPLAGTHP